jgi:hypothetical protein
MTQTLDRESHADVAGNPAFESMVARLSKLSVDKHFEAYVDIDWDDPALAVDPTDARWSLWDVDPLGHTDWYRSLPADHQARVGLYRLAACMKVGWQFENWLQGGLLEVALALPNGSPSFRYLHHEITEESQHSMMFQELVNRSGLPVRGMPRWIMPLRPLVMRCARHAPELFFIMVLGGEDPIDHVQRQQLKGDNSHPLAEKIMRIHVTEEARHLSFARHTLKHRVPQLNRLQRHALALLAPVILGIMVRLMVWPQGDLVRHCGVPKDVLRAANRSPEGRALLADALAKARRLCGELGLLTAASRPIWKAMGIWAD